MNRVIGLIVNPAAGMGGSAVIDLFDSYEKGKILFNKDQFRQS